MWARTFSASCSSNELEWVFFSVTPTSGSASRMALLLTSSSLARSLIRTLLIRPFFSPRCARSSLQPHGVSFVHPHTNENVCACHVIQFFREQNLPAHALDFLLAQFQLRRAQQKPSRLLRRPLQPLLPVQPRRKPLRIRLHPPPFLHLPEPQHPGWQNNYSPQG